MATARGACTGGTAGALGCMGRPVMAGPETPAEEASSLFISLAGLGTGEGGAADTAGGCRGGRSPVCLCMCCFRAPEPGHSPCSLQTVHVLPQQACICTSVMQPADYAPV